MTIIFSKAKKDTNKNQLYKVNDHTIIPKNIYGRKYFYLYEIMAMVPYYLAQHVEVLIIHKPHRD